jgi:hypothetical protein
MSQMEADLTPERARYLEENGEVLTIEAVEHIAKVVGTDSAAQKLLDEIKTKGHDGIEPMVILDKRTNSLVLIWGKK